MTPGDHVEVTMTDYEPWVAGCTLAWLDVGCTHLCRVVSRDRDTGKAVLQVLSSKPYADRTLSRAAEAKLMERCDAAWGEVMSSADEEGP